MCVFSSSVPETNSQDIYYLENGGQPAQGIFIGCCITYPKNFFHKFHLIVFNYLSALTIQSIKNLIWSKKHFSITTPVISAWLEGWKRITKIDFQHDKTAFYGKMYICGILRRVTLSVAIVEPLYTPYLWLLYCINNTYKSLTPAVLSLSLFCVLTILFYCFWLQVHCTYLSHQNKYALYIDTHVLRMFKTKNIFQSVIVAGIACL